MYVKALPLNYYNYLQKHCKKAKDELWIHYKPSLFQHIGTHSSLRGKVQKLKVGYFKGSLRFIEICRFFFYI